MGDEKDSSTLQRGNRVSRTHPVLGDSSPEARASRLKTEVVPASMVGRLRDDLIAGKQNLDPQSFSPQKSPQPVEPSPLSETATRTHPVSPTAPPSSVVSGTPPAASGTIAPPPTPSANFTVNTSAPASPPLEESEEFSPQELPDHFVPPGLRPPLNGESEQRYRNSPPKPKGILVDRRQAAQGRETIRQMREARGKRNAESGGFSADTIARAHRTYSRRRAAIVVVFGIFVSLAIVRSSPIPSKPKTAPAMPPTNTAQLTEKSQLIPGSIFKPVEGPLTFPRLPSGLYTGRAKGILADRDVSLTIISHNNGNQIGVILGVEGWSSPVTSPTPEDTYLTANSGGWRIRFIMKRADDELMVGRWENTFTKEVGEWTLAPLR